MGENRLTYELTEQQLKMLLDAKPRKSMTDFPMYHGYRIRVTIAIAYAVELREPILGRWMVLDYLESLEAAKKWIDKRLEDQTVGWDANGSPTVEIGSPVTE